MKITLSDQDVIWVHSIYLKDDRRLEAASFVFPHLGVITTTKSFGNDICCTCLNQKQIDLSLPVAVPRSIASVVGD